MADNFVQRFLSIRIGGRYRLLERLGKGTFGLVYLGCDTLSGDEVAIKLEHCRIDPSLLGLEIDIYKSLEGRHGFPRVFWHGFQDDFRVMVFELLGPNLEDLLQYCGGRFSIKTTSTLMCQLLRRLESLHRTGYCHRDIKPENFMLGTGRTGNVVYMTDLGLAFHLRVSERQSEFPERTKPPRLALIGTCSYASINGHLDVTSSFRDDLESLGYMVLYFLRGSLPWQCVQISNHKERYERVLELKRQTGVDELCKGLPAAFATYMNYLRQMEDPNRPDYAYLRGLFEAKRLGFSNDNVFDWTILEFKRLSTCQPPETKTGDGDSMTARHQLEKVSRRKRRKGKATRS